MIDKIVTSLRISAVPEVMSDRGCCGDAPASCHAAGGVDQKTVGQKMGLLHVVVAAGWLIWSQPFGDWIGPSAPDWPVGLTVAADERGWDTT